jgi:hypothetical protein
MKMKKLHYLAVILLAISTIISAQQFETGEIGIMLNDFGRARILNSDLATRQIDRFSILVAQAPGFVFDYANDSEVVDSSKNIEPATIGDFELMNINDNSATGNPPAVLNHINIYGWSGGAYALIKYSLVSNESSSYDAKIGFEILPQIDGNYGAESVEFLNNEGVIRIYKSNGLKEVGIKILSDDIQSLKIFEWYDGYNGFDDSLYNWLNYGEIDGPYNSGPDGTVDIPSIASKNFAPGDTIKVYVGIALGMDTSEMLANIASVEALYNGLVTDVENEFNIVPDEYVLYQNYPNPFNPTTEIKFNLIKSDYVQLTVFNAVGEEVTKLINNELNAGLHTVKFDASGLSSGIYFYKISTNEFISVNKMMLLK